MRMRRKRTTRRRSRRRNRGRSPRGVLKANRVRPRRGGFRA